MKACAKHESLLSLLWSTKKYILKNVSSTFGPYLLTFGYQSTGDIIKISMLI